MAHQRDDLVMTTLSKTANTFATQGSNAEAGVEFERALYSDLVGIGDWRHIAGPDEFDLGGLLQSRTGIRYEFDCVVLSADALYVVEAKRHLRITRQHVSEFLSKLLDIVLGSVSEAGVPAIKPIFVSGLSQIDDAAIRYAVSWGVPIIAPSRPTPWDLLTLLRGSTIRTDAARSIIRDCEATCQYLWRPINATVRVADAASGRFCLSTSDIYDAQRVSDILEFWSDCHRSAEALINAWPAT